MLSKRLRAETADHHRSLETLLALTRPGFTKDSYRSLLERFYGFHVRFESAASPILDRDLPGFFTLRRKTSLLSTDLRALGRANLSDIPLCDDPPTVETYWDALGACYVVEGATLGGQVLSRHFNLALGVTESTGGAFFSGYGARVSLMWRSFLELLDRPATAEEQDAVIRSAQRTFDRMRTWLTPWAVS